MAFKIEVYKSVANEQVNQNFTYSNCSKVEIVKKDTYYTENEKFYPEIILRVSQNSSQHIYDKLFTPFLIQDENMYVISSVDLYNSTTKKHTFYDYELSSENAVCIDEDFINSLGFNSNSTVKIIIKYKQCKALVFTQTKPDQKYYGYPKILYGNNDSNTVVSEYIALTDQTNQFWICENIAGIYATKFDCWNIRLFTIKYEENSDSYTSKEVFIDDDTKIIEKYTGATHYLSSVDFYQPQIDKGDHNLKSVRNENLIKYSYLKNTQIYQQKYLRLIADKKFCYFVIEACYDPKTPRLTFWKNVIDETIFYKNYVYGCDLSDYPLSGHEISMTRKGYDFDGYYTIASENSGYYSLPTYKTRLDQSSDYTRVTDKNGNYVAKAPYFCGENYIFINTILDRYVIANWIPKTTKIKLNWNVESGCTVTPNGTLKYETSEIYDTTCENLISSKEVKIPTVKKVINGKTVTLNFLGFYTSAVGGEQIISGDGVFCRNTKYTRRKLWKCDEYEITLYAHWSGVAYYDLYKEGNMPDGYKPYYGSPSFEIPVGEKLNDDNYYAGYKPYLCYFDEETGKFTDAGGNELSNQSEPVIDNEMNFSGYYLLNDEGNYGEQIIRSDGEFFRGTSCADGIKKNKKDGYVKLWAYWYGDKLRIRTGSNNTNFGTTSGEGTYKKSKDCTITAKVKDSNKYCFLGWQKDGVSLDNGYISKSLSFTFKVEKSEKYIGYFNTKQYNINYKDVGGGKCSSENYLDPTSVNSYGIYKPGELLPLATTYDGGTIIQKGYKKDYDFKGWYTDSAGTKELVKNKNGDYVIQNGITSDITLYAKWEKITKSYFVYLNPGTGSFNSTMSIPKISVTYGYSANKLSETHIPVLDRYKFNGFYDDLNIKIIDETGRWRQNCDYVSNGKFILTQDLNLYAKYTKNLEIVDNLGIKLNNIYCDIEKIDNLKLYKFTDKKIATINWINSAIGVPEYSNYGDSQKNYYTDNMNQNYNSKRLIADKYFFNNFDCDDNKCLKQNNIVDFFNSANTITSNFYIKDITYENNQTSIMLSFIKDDNIIFPDNYNDYKNTIFYITINDNKDCVYKVSISSTIYNLKVFLPHLSFVIPDCHETINKITIEQIPCFAIRNDDNTTNYYKQFIKFNKNSSGLENLEIENNTILNNMSIGTYTPSTSIEEVPSFPGGSIVG
jgi:uncharacterized repeat protein (TIGR02543 family)